MKTQTAAKKIPRKGLLQRSSLGQINKEYGKRKIELIDLSHPDPGNLFQHRFEHFFSSYLILPLMVLFCLEKKYNMGLVIYFFGNQDYFD